MVIMEPTSWHAIQEFFERQTQVYRRFARYAVLFRGQSNFDWRIHSSLSRIFQGDPTSESKLRAYEFQAQQEFRSKIHLLEPSMDYPRDYNSILLSADMQHFSFPTRLVDWTRSPYIALYFAINENFDHDGALFIWVRLPYKKCMSKKFPNFDEIDYRSISTIDEFDALISVVPNRLNERLIRQQGLFTVSNNLVKPHCSLICDEFEKDKGDNGLVKLRIRKDLKLEVLSRLRIMNITAESLFPGLDGLGRATKEQLLLKRWAKM